MSQIETNPRPPRDDLFRAVYPGVELREQEGEKGPTLFGHFARFNEWTEIDSIFEGRFMERFAPGAFKKTIAENRASMRVLFQHGRDPQIGDKPLGPINSLREDEEGTFYEVDLLDAPYVREGVLPGLKAGLYGASFRFQVVREDLDKEPPRSDHNPDGMPERTVREARVMEFGPVTFPAYQGATAGVRSITDEFFIQRLATQPERLRRLIEWLDTDPSEASRTIEETPVDAGSEARAEDHPDGEQDEQDNAPPSQGAEAEPHPLYGRRGNSEPPLYGADKEEGPKWSLKTRQEAARRSRLG